MKNKLSGPISKKKQISLAKYSKNDIMTNMRYKIIVWSHNRNTENGFTFSNMLWFAIRSCTNCHLEGICEI